MNKYTAIMTITPHTMDIDEDHRPRYVVFSKMEKIIRDMQHPENGVPVRCQKIFLTTIPCAFTGYDVIEWIMERLNIEDGTEALHFASLLCQYGYFFPVTDTKNLTVKDDGTLYRFQTPYFWPSQNWEPDNVDYAIYLAKRSMRNKQKHALEEHEQAALTKLQKMLCDKWDFIFMQAEEQVRLAKERKKADKVVLDSQERAFWRVHRPAMGSVRCLEEGVKRNFKPSQMERRRKNIESYKRDIEFLHRCLNHPRMKTSKAMESLVHHSEHYVEHDPVLCPPQPSNPWISDDPSMWSYHTIGSGPPTERQVKRWAFGLKEMLMDLRGRQEFEVFLQKEFSSENLMFWKSCQELKGLPLSRVEFKVNEIYKEFLAPGAPNEINIDGKTMEKTLVDLKTPSRFTFDSAEYHIYTLMKKDSYARFLRSDQYKNLLATAIHPVSKKKFFIFGGTKKKSPNPSPKPKRRGSAESTGPKDKDGSGSVYSQHSFSTGNLRDLVSPDGSKSNKSSPAGSSGDLKGADSGSESSPKHSQHRSDDECRSGSRRSSKTLDVPNQRRSFSIIEHKFPDEPTISIAVPNTTHNVVAPWEDEA